jgi:hypothetical protein
MLYQLWSVGLSCRKSKHISGSARSSTTDQRQTPMLYIISCAKNRTSTTESTGSRTFVASDHWLHLSEAGTCLYIHGLPPDARLKDSRQRIGALNASRKAIRWRYTVAACAARD